jgi:hypothetical protein
VDETAAFRTWRAHRGRRWTCLAEALVLGGLITGDRP